MRGVDGSDNQDATLPWPQWFAGGGRIAVLRATLGFYEDRHFARYVAEAYAAGFLVGAYHVILGHVHYAIERQAQDFLDRLTSQISFVSLDLEAPGVSDADVLEWVAYIAARIGSMPLILYGNWDLARVVLAHLEILGQYGIWWAGYPTFPNPCTDPPWPFPRNVPADLLPRIVAWQFAGDNGVFAPYPKAIDLTDWYEVPGQVAPPPGPPLDRIDAAVLDIRGAI